MRQGFRVGSDLVRYHQIGLASGWVEVEGIRTELSPDTWVSTRDHSWGVRYDVGLPPRDLEPRDPLAGLSFRMIWSPIAMQRPDGTRYGIFLHYQIVAGPRVHLQAGRHGRGRAPRRNGASASSTSSRNWISTPTTAGCAAGAIEARTADGSVRSLELEAVSDTGFHLGAGLYFGLDGHHHGEWRGDLLVEGEHVADCADPAAARRLHQIRDTVVHVVDPVGGGEGWGNCQPIITGGDDALGLSPDDSFM